MGIYYNKFVVREAEELDSVQDPDNTGNDLDQIEKDIVGSDGIEAHSEEIEDADEGVIDEPLEETANYIMYESETNFNTLMQAIGIKELNEAAKGRDFVLEGANFDTFMEKVKSIITKMFEGITKAFRNVMVKIRSANVIGKKFIQKNEKAVIAGASVLKAKSNEDLGEKFKVYNIKADLVFKASDAKIDSAVDIDKMISMAKDKEIPSDFIRSTKKEMVHFTFECEEDDINDAANKYKEKLYGKKVIALKDTSIDEYIKILKNAKETGEITKSYYATKDAYKKALTLLDNAKKKALKADKENNSGNSKTGIKNCCTAYADMVKFAQNCVNRLFVIHLAAAKTKFNQAYRIAKACAKAGGDSVKGESAAVHNESNIFSNMNFI